MARDSCLKGHADTFECFGGMPQMLAPDSCGTATGRAPVYVTLVNATYPAFAKGIVNLAEQWIVSPANEESFRTLDEPDNFVFDHIGWLNGRPSSDKGGLRRGRYERDERAHAGPVGFRFETYEPHRAKAAPDCHIRPCYMHNSVPFAPVGKACDIRACASRIVVACDGKVVAERLHLRGRKGQYPTFEGRMPPSHRVENPTWSREHSES